MASNFPQHMGGQMMPQQQQRQQQRPPNGNVPREAIMNMIHSAIQNQPQNPQGWQTQVLTNERLGIVMNILASIRLASQNQPGSPTLHKMVELAIRFERDIFEKSADKAAYKREVDSKLDQLMKTREKQQAGLQQSIQQQAQAQAQAQQAQQAQVQQMMMNQNNMQAQMNRNMAQQQPFQHLQHQMQASPIPGQQQPQMSMGMSNDGLPANMNPNAQQQFQMQLHQQQQQQQQQQGQLNMAGRPPNQQANVLTPQENAWVQEMANRSLASASEEQKANLRAQVQSKMSPVQLQSAQTSGMDLAFYFFRQQAHQKLRTEKAMRAAQLGIPQGPSATAMQPQRSMNPSPLNVQAQAPQGQMGGNGDGFMNMGDIAAQQQQGVMAQNTGEVVVPVSNIQRNATPQPGMPNQRTQQQQQQQQLFNAQQQRLQQQQQQQQQQNQARLNAQAKTQQIGLQGQPGGMGPGPMPPQQSPAMSTLNAPMRTPGQQMNQQGPEAQVNPGAAQFGQPLDPRFARQMGPGSIAGMNMPGGNPAAMIAEPRQQNLANLPQEKLNELIARWGEPRIQQQLNAQAQAQGLRPGMPMQGNLGQPGQQLQPSQPNPQAALIQQYMNANPGRPLPQSVAPGMSAQQQLMLQQQMAARMQAQAQNQNQMQQRNAPPTPMEQRMISTMDTMDFPPQVYTHPQIPQGIPPEIKKWGQLKQWAQQHPNVGPTTLDHIRSLQKLHYQNLARSRQQAAVSMMQAPQAGMPPGMSAPVPPMGQNPGQMPMNNGIRPPTQEEINTLKTHPQFAGATEEQIRHFLTSRNAQMTPAQQRQRNQHLHNMQQSQLQQRRAGPQQPNPAAVPPMIGQVPPPKPPQQTTEQPVAPMNVNRQSQPQPNSRAAPTSSPAPPQNKLKRASSDDVVEVPNPNAQQPKPIPQPALSANPQPLRLPPTLTPQQVANLDPEARKRYETMLRMRQQGVPFNPADIQKLRSINEEEAKRPLDPPIPMDAQTKSSTAARLRSIVQSLTNVTKAIPKWYQITHDEARLRVFFQTKNRIQAQFEDPDLKVLKDTFSIRPQEVEQARSMLGSIVKDLSDKFPSMMMKQDSAQQPAPTSQPAPPAQNAPTSAAQSMPLNAANLQQQQQQLSKLHQRSNSHSSRPPAAPTSSQPPFQFGAPSPHGTPGYIGKTTVTHETLHIPARKRQKQNNAAAPGQTTPGSNTSPQVSKVVSPELKRDQAQFRPQAKLALVCPEPECERHNVGFETQEALAAHTHEEHIKPLQDPAKYAQENLAALLSLDSQGNSMQPAAVGQDLNVAVKMEPTGSKQGPNSNMKDVTSTGTPVNRRVSSVDLKPKDTPKIGGQPARKDNQPSQISQERPDPWFNTTIDPHDLFQAFQSFESGAGGAISDMNVYRSINTPNDTPESSNQVSEPTSDISDGVALDISLDIFDDAWQPFGRGVGIAADDDLIFPIGDEEELKMFDEPPPNYTTWEDLVDPGMLDKPFAFDTSLFSMDVE